MLSTASRAEGLSRALPADINMSARKPGTEGKAGVDSARRYTWACWGCKAGKPLWRSAAYHCRLTIVVRFRYTSCRRNPAGPLFVLPDKTSYLSNLVLCHGKLCARTGTLQVAILTLTPGADLLALPVGLGPQRIPHLALYFSPACQRSRCSTGARSGRRP